MTGTVYCLGFAPEEFKVRLEEHLSEYESEEQLQHGIARHMFTLMAGGDTTGLENALRTANTWTQKLDACVRTLLGRVPHSAQYARALIECALVRITAMRGYVAPARALRSQLVLLRAATTTTILAPLSLQQHSQQPVAVHQLRAPLAHAAWDLQCTAIVNEYLHPAIQDDFNKKNICDTYLLNANSFMAIEHDHK